MNKLFLFFLKFMVFQNILIYQITDYKGIKKIFIFIIYLLFYFYHKLFDNKVII
jgi:hypothetical protein